MHEKDKSRQVNPFKLPNESTKYEVTLLVSIASIKFLTEKEFKEDLWWIAEAIPARVRKGQSNITTSPKSSQFIKHRVINVEITREINLAMF